MPSTTLDAFTSTTGCWDIWSCQYSLVYLGWVKSHIGIGGNEAADEEAKKATEGQNLSRRAAGARAEGTRAEGTRAESMRAENARAESRTLITEWGVKQRVSARRREDRQQAG